MIALKKELERSQRELRRVRSESQAIAVKRYKDDLEDAKMELDLAYELVAKRRKTVEKLVSRFLKYNRDEIQFTNTVAGAGG
jgi:hypothetical protein